MDTKKLRQKILDLAIRGKLVPQDPNDEPASVLLERIREEKKQMVKEGKLKAKDIKNDTIIFKGEDNLHYEKFQDGTIKCIEDEIPFELPEGWEWCRIGSLFDTVTGSTPSTKNKEYYGEEYPFFKPSDLDCGYNVFSSTDHVSKAGYEAGRPLAKKSVLVTCIGATIGKIGLIQTSGICNQQINAMLPSKYMDSDYTYYCMCSEFEQSQIINNASATTLPILNKSRFDMLLFIVPPIQQQNKISVEINKYIKMLNSLEENKESLQESISNIKSKLLDLAIRGKLVSQDPNDEPASVLLERIRKEKEELIKQGKLKRDKKESIIYKGDDNSYYEKFADGTSKCIDNEIPFNIPNNWTWCRLVNISSIIMGTSPKGTSLTSDEKYTEFHQGKIFFSDKYLFKGNQFTSEITKIAPSDSVLLCVRAPVGEVNITQREICIGRGLSSISPLYEINAEFIYYWIKAFKHSLEEKATGTTFIAITTDIVKDLLLPMPPLNEQVNIIETIKEYYDSIEIIEASLS